MRGLLLQRLKAEASDSLGQKIAELRAAMFLDVGDNKGVGWRFALQLDASFQQLQEFYSAQCITDAILDELQKHIASVQEAKERDKSAKQAAGDVVAMDDHSDIDTLVKVAAATACEWKLLQAFKGDTPPRRTEVVAAVRALRPLQVKEHDVIHPSLFQNAWSILTPKKTV